MNPSAVRAASLKRSAKALRAAADECDESIKSLQQRAWDLRKLADDKQLEAAQLMTGEKI